jgi:hypothetical protein
MKKCLMLAVVAVLAGVLVCGCTLKKTGPSAKTYQAFPRGDAEVPPVATAAKASATFGAGPAKMQLKFDVDVKNIKDVFSAQLCLAPKGVNGPVVAILYPGPMKLGITTGVLWNGALTKMDLLGPMAGLLIEDLMNEIAAGKIYVNIRTKAHPAGELRGQVH